MNRHLSLLCIALSLIISPLALAQDDGGDDSEIPIDAVCQKAEFNCLLSLLTDYVRADDELSDDESEEYASNISPEQESLRKVFELIADINGFYSKSPSVTLKLSTKSELKNFKGMDDLNWQELTAEELDELNSILAEDESPTLAEIYEAAGALKKNSLSKEKLKLIAKFIKLPLLPLLTGVLNQEDTDALEKSRLKAEKNLKKLLSSRK